MPLTIDGNKFIPQVGDEIAIQHGDHDGIMIVPLIQFFRNGDRVMNGADNKLIAAFFDTTPSDAQISKFFFFLAQLFGLRIRMREITSPQWTWAVFEAE